MSFKSEDLHIVGITGAVGSGKSRLAKEISSMYPGSVILGMDRYFKAKRDIENFKQLGIEGPHSVDIDRFLEHVLELRANGKAYVPFVAYVKDDIPIVIRDKEEISAENVLILDGYLLFHDPRILELIDIKIFVDTPLDICLSRGLIRDCLEREFSIEENLMRYESEIRSAYFKYVFPTKKYADFVLDNSQESGSMRINAWWNAITRIGALLNKRKF